MSFTYVSSSGVDNGISRAFSHPLDVWEIVLHVYWAHKKFSVDTYLGLYNFPRIEMIFLKYPLCSHIEIFCSAGAILV